MRSLDSVVDTTLPMWKYADVTLKDGRTIKLLENDFWDNGLRIIEETSGSNSFDIGAAVVSSLETKLNNLDGKFNDYDFEGALVVPQCYYSKKERFGTYEFVFDENLSLGDGCFYLTYNYFLGRTPRSRRLKITEADLKARDYKIRLETPYPVALGLRSPRRNDGTCYAKNTSVIVRATNAEGNTKVLSGQDTSTPDIYTVTIINSKDVAEETFYDDFGYVDLGAPIKGYFGRYTTIAQFRMYDLPVSYCKMGEYTISGAPVDYASILSLTAYDALHLLDKELDLSAFDFESGVQIGQILNAAITQSKVASSRFKFNGLERTDYYNAVVTQKIYKNPNFRSCREALSNIAQLLGTFIKATVDGGISFEWYETSATDEEKSLVGGIFDDNRDDVYTTGSSFDGLVFTSTSWPDNEYYPMGTIIGMSKTKNVSTTFGRSVSGADVIISGISVGYTDGDEEGTIVSSDNHSYLLSINNILVQSKEFGEKVAEYLDSKITGMRFRPFDTQILSDPTVERGDPVRIFDANGKDVYMSFITKNEFCPGELQRISNSAVPMLRQQSTTADSETKIIRRARSLMETDIKDHDKVVLDFSKLISNSMGLFMEQVQKEDGSVITILHTKKDKMDDDSVWYVLTAGGFAFSRDHGKTYEAGFDNDGNAIFNVLDAIGIRFEWAHGDTLKLGGKNNVNGEIIVYDTNGNEVARVNQNGVTADKGTFKGELNGATGTFSGSLSAATGTFKGTLTSGSVVSSTITSSELKSAKATFLPSKDGHSIKVDGNGIYGSSYNELHLVQTTDKGSDFTNDAHRMAGVYFTDDATISGSLWVKGEKSRVVDTYTGQRLMYCDEMPSPMFSDCGIITLNEDGIGIVDFDEEFINATNTDVKYIVLLTKNGPGDCWVSEKTESYFVINGTPNLTIDWVVKGSQRYYEAQRLDLADKSIYDDAQKIVEEVRNAYEDFQYIVEDEADKIINELLGELDYEED